MLPFKGTGRKGRAEPVVAIIFGTRVVTADCTATRIICSKPYCWVATTRFAPNKIIKK